MYTVHCTLKGYKGIVYSTVGENINATIKIRNNNGAIIQISNIAIRLPLLLAIAIKSVKERQHW